MRVTARLLALCAASACASTPKPVAPPSRPVAAAPTDPTPSPAPGARASTDMQAHLNDQVDTFDWKSRPPPPSDDPTTERARGLFLGANLAYAAKAKVEVDADSMTGTADFATAFAAEVQAGYRLFPFLSVALVPQMFFNLQPHQVDAARELDVFAQTTGHLALSSRWDFNLFVAPGYSVLFVPGADDASGLAFRWGAGPMFHLTRHMSFAAELCHQIGFQNADRASGSVGMETSFLSLLAGIRVRQ